MNICVYGASSSALDASYIEAVEELGAKMALRGHGLVFGAGSQGLMGAAARGMARNNGTIIGVAPHFFNTGDILFTECTVLHLTETMRERKQYMEENSDAFVVAPGGIGTFDEFFEILTLRFLGRHQKPIAIFNVNGYYNELIAFLRKSVKEKFLSEAIFDVLFVSDQVDEILNYLEDQHGASSSDGQ